MTSTPLSVDVLILGGGTAGCAAGWQAARMGARTLVVEETPWLGGMVTAAGVSAFDGNKRNHGTGFYRILRDAIAAHYGGHDKVFTGWISETCFEPRLAAGYLNQWVPEAGAEVWFGARLVEVLLEGKRVVGARVSYQGQVREVRAKVTLEATDYGDVLEKAGIPHWLGRESQSETGEEHAPEKPDLEVQDLTWCAILKKDASGRAKPVPAPEGYDPTVFDGCIADYSTERDEGRLNHKLHSWESFINYALLPNDKYLLNWPFHSNDSPDTLGVFGTAEERQRAFEAARKRTLAFVHFMQTELKHPEWGLAEDEFETPDHLAYMPYMRECRRAKGVQLLKEEDVVPAKGCTRGRFQADSIAIGDYYLDHHHSKMHLPPGKRLEENYPDNGPFQVPYGCLVPAEHDGLLVTEKSISVTHIVNGCSRLQPVVMLMGQAAGAAAALCVAKGIEPRALNVRELQEYLINEGVALYPTWDVAPDHPHWAAIQRAAMRGAFPAEQRQEIQPDEVLSTDAARQLAERWTKANGGDAAGLAAALAGKTRGEACAALLR